MFISEIQSPSNWPCVGPQLVPTTLNESTEVLRLVHSPMTRRNKGETIFQCYKQLSQCVHTKNMHVHIILSTHVNSWHGFIKSIISSATEMLSKLCICTEGICITEELLEDSTTICFCTIVHFLIHNCSIMIYTHTH